MAKFDPAYAVVVGLEGGYKAADGVDAETIHGINREHNPDWKGWPLVDALKDNPGFPMRANNDPEVFRLAKERYRSGYWLLIAGDLLPEQEVATKLLDLAVHAGVRTAGKMLQETLNLLRRPHETPLYDALLVDGVIGKKTVEAYRLLQEKDGPDKAGRYVMALLRGMQTQFYIELASRMAYHSKNLRGYLRRV